MRKWRIASGEETGEQPEARFRLEQPDWKKDGTWEWQDNPFVGTRELQRARRDDGAAELLGPQDLE